MIRVPGSGSFTDFGRCLIPDIGDSCPIPHQFPSKTAHGEDRLEGGLATRRNDVIAATGVPRSAPAPVSHGRSPNFERASDVRHAASKLGGRIGSACSRSVNVHASEDAHSSAVMKGFANANELSDKLNLLTWGKS